MKKIIILLLLIVTTVTYSQQISVDKLQKSIHQISLIYDGLPKHIQNKIVVKYTTVLKGMNIKSFKYDKVAYDFIKLKLKL